MSSSALAEPSLISSGTGIDSTISKIRPFFSQSSFLNYFDQPDRPQTKLDRNLENGMAVSIGRLREDKQYDYKFVCLSHNTLRGAAGGGVLMAELLCAKGYI